MIKDDVIQLVLEFTYKYISPKEADQIIALIELPKDKPPLLNETELDYRWRKGLAIESDHQDAAREVAQAQREADIEFYGGKG